MKKKMKSRTSQQLLSLLIIVFLNLSASQLTAQVSGTVWQDLPVTGAVLNSYGVKEANELGVEGITVTAYPGGMSTITAADGTYSLATGAGGFRIEFSWVASPWLQSSPDGTVQNTSVQFVTAPAGAVNFGMHNPKDFFDTANPTIAASFLTNGSGVGNTNLSLITTPYVSAGRSSSIPGGAGPVPTTIATAEEIGCVWGQSWDRNETRLFSASFLKRHTGLLDNLGHVYITDYVGGVPSFINKFDLTGIATVNGGTLDFGTVCRDAACAAAGTGITADYVLNVNPGLPNRDLDAYGKVAKVGMGGIDIQEDKDILWIVNLKQRALITVDISGASASLPGAGNVDQYLLSALPGLPSCNGGELRPWGIKFNNGRGYIGFVCDASISQSTADLDAIVVSFDPNNIAAGFTSELTVNLDYARSTHLIDGEFDPWSDVFTFPPLVQLYGTIQILDSPVLSDIDFDAAGNMYLNFLNRFSHQYGHNNNKPVSGDNTTDTRAISSGEILKVCKTGAGWLLEGDVACPMGYGGTGLGPNQATFGPGEYFYDTPGDAAPGQTGESSNGAGTIIKGSNKLVVASMDPNPEASHLDYHNTQGWNVLNLSTGHVDYFYTVLKGDIEMFGKSNGMGDIELLAAPAPVEIGNLVWLDTDSDGVQDADESGIAGVEVKLFKSDGTTLLGTAITDANGNYIFSNDPNGPLPNVGDSHIYQINMLMAEQAYIVRIENASGGSKQAVIGAMNELILANAGEGANGGINNTDGVANGTSADATVTTLSVPLKGANNHTFDFAFGLELCPPVRCGTIGVVKN